MTKTTDKIEGNRKERRPGLWAISLIVTTQIVGLVLFSMTTPAPVEAKTFVVNSFLDEPDTDMPLGDGECRSASGKCTLRAAVQEANWLDGPDVIKLDAGLYTLTIPGKEDFCASGDLDIISAGFENNDLTIVGMDAKKTFINGGKLDRVFHILSPVSVTIAKVTIQNGLATDGGVSQALGGGILTTLESTLTVKECTISNNAASHTVDARGGGIYNSGTLQVTKSILSNNAALGGSGNAVGGAIYNNGTLKIRATTIFNNIVSGPNLGFGGAIMNSSGVTAEIRQSTIANNTVSVQGAYGEGGGIFSNGTLTVIQSTISNNTAQGVSGDGGGIFNGQAPGTLTITNSIISSNVARGAFASGGGVATFWGEVIITGSTLSNNAASGVSGNPGRGGGIFVGDYTTVTVQGASKILRNFSSNEGGGICYGGAGTGTVSGDSRVAKNIPDDIIDLVP